MPYLSANVTKTAEIIQIKQQKCEETKLWITKSKKKKKTKPFSQYAVIYIDHIMPKLKPRKDQPLPT